ncbi:MAG: hypothetical protein JM58_05385 [Peptococcaceae bacterium BICA1-8]|nr:MAG: hypothetical protein JM58_05385 [Peptococcaceae bacterium BICA1-8]
MYCALILEKIKQIGDEGEIRVVEVLKNLQQISQLGMSAKEKQKMITVSEVLVCLGYLAG